MNEEYELILQCYRSGQMSEAQWQAHLSDDGFRAWHLLQAGVQPGALSAFISHTKRLYTGDPKNHKDWPAYKAGFEDAQPAARAERCLRCEGSGTMSVLSDSSPDAHAVEVDCDHCRGSGALSDAAKHLAAALADEKRRHMALWGEYRNFHRSLCQRFGYGHDHVHFRRDLVSLEEAIAAKIPAPVAAQSSAPIAQIQSILDKVQDSMQDAYNNGYQECCGRGAGGECCGNPDVSWSKEDQQIMDMLNPIQRDLSAILASHTPPADGQAWEDAARKHGVPVNALRAIAQLETAQAQQDTDKVDAEPVGYSWFAPISKQWGLCTAEEKQRMERKYSSDEGSPIVFNPVYAHAQPDPGMDIRPSPHPLPKPDPAMVWDEWVSELKSLVEIYGNLAQLAANFTALPENKYRSNPHTEAVIGVYRKILAHGSKRVQPASEEDAKRIAWLSENDCMIERLVSTKGTRYRLSWGDTWQSDWYDTPGQAIDAAMQQERQP